jgi:hypothetical protein
MTNVVLAVLVALQLALAGYYGWKSVRTLRRTGPLFEMMPDERQFLRRQGWRRLVNSIFMFLFACLLPASHLSGLEARADKLGDERVKQRAEAHRNSDEGNSAAPDNTSDGPKNDRPPPEMTPEQKRLAHLYAGFWIVALVLLAIILILAGIDVLATRSYAMMKLREYQADRNEQVQRELDRWRRERNGERNGDR